jgi:hypothetical protein
MQQTKAELPGPANDRDIYSGMMRLRILWHPAERPIFDLGMVEGLAVHGYRISLETFHPLWNLHTC